MRETSCEIRVRYGETDAMGIVYYANYLSWFEVGRSDLLRQLGASYRSIETDEEIHLPVVEAQCRYLKPARYDDLVRVRTRVSPLSRVQLRFEYQLDRVEDGVRLAEGSTLHVAVRPNGKPCRLPTRLTELLE